MLDYAKDLDLKLPLEPTVLNAMHRNRELELKRYRLFYIRRLFCFGFIGSMEESVPSYVHAMKFYDLTQKVWERTGPGWKPRVEEFENDVEFTN